MSKSKINLFWFRRDLRLEDNRGLSAALNSGIPVQCIFIFDTTILEQLSDKKDARVLFIHQQLEQINTAIQKTGGTLWTFYGTPKSVLEKLIKEYAVHAVYTNHDYEPAAIERDSSIEKLLVQKQIGFHTFKDQVIFEKKDVVKDDGLPYTVFTPYKKKWLEHFSKTDVAVQPVKPNGKNIHQTDAAEVLSLPFIGFKDFKYTFEPVDTAKKFLQRYADTRNIPHLRTSRASLHLRFGTVSIREMFRKAMEAHSDAWFNELVWREFYMMILFNFPYVVNGPFKKQYGDFPWRNNEKEFQKWCDGNTGYPIVDAGMRELNTTGFMHNRVRMITASFLTKHLLIDWRWGEAYFANKLLDFELSSNNGGWQWAAGCGCDAAPYFRIFNPAEQTKKFDPELKYTRKWVPEMESLEYPQPMVDHKMARERCLKVFKSVLYND